MLLDLHFSQFQPVPPMCWYVLVDPDNNVCSLKKCMHALVYISAHSVVKMGLSVIGTGD
jgi:hypothetical protein